MNTTENKANTITNAARALAADLCAPGTKLGLSCTVEDGSYVFRSLVTTPHHLDVFCSDESRVRAHWLGYCEAAEDAYRKQCIANEAVFTRSSK